MNQFDDDETRVDMGIPGAVIDRERLDDGVIVERNGAGTIVALVYPYGIEDEYAHESLEDRIDRLARELKQARAELKRGLKS